MSTIAVVPDTRSGRAMSGRAHSPLRAGQAAFPSAANSKSTARKIPVINTNPIIFAARSSDLLDESRLFKNRVDRAKTLSSKQRQWVRLNWILLLLGQLYDGFDQCQTLFQEQFTRTIKHFVFSFGRFGKQSQSQPAAGLMTNRRQGS